MFGWMEVIIKTRFLLSSESVEFHGDEEGKKMDAQRSETNSKALITLLLAVFIDLLGFGIVIPLLPFWVTSFTSSDFVYGMLVAIYSIMQFIFAPIWGRLSDRFGRRPIILIGLTGTLIGFSLLSVTALFMNTLEMLFAARIISGIFTSATLPTSQAYISDTTSGKDRAKSYGMLGAAFGVGFAFGPAIGGGLFYVGKNILGLVGYETPALFASFLALVNLVAGLAYLPETLPAVARSNLRKTKREKQEAHAGYGIRSVLLENKSIIVIMVVFATVTLGFSAMETTIALFGKARFGLDETLTGFVFFVVGIVAIITQGGIIRPLSKRYHEAYLAAFGLLMLIFSFLGLTTVYSLEFLTLWVIPLAFGSSIENPTLNSLLSKKAPKEYQGGVMGLNQGLSSLMRILGPLMGTFLLEIDTSLPYLAGAFLFFLAFLLTLLLVIEARKSATTRLGPTTCLNCGLLLQEGAAFCSRCGSPVE